MTSKQKKQPVKKKWPDLKILKFKTSIQMRQHTGKICIKFVTHKWLTCVITL